MIRFLCCFPSVCLLLSSLAVFVVPPASAQETLAERFARPPEGESSPKSKRNAQNLSSVCSAAQAAGHDFTAGAGDTRTVVERLALGASIGAGRFAGEYFGVPNISKADQDAALRHLDLKNGILRYLPEPKPAEGEGSGTAGMHKAQEIVIQCRRYQLQGIHDFVANKTDPDKVLDALARGAHSPTGRVFIGFTEWERNAVLPHLVIENGVLKYTQAGKVEDATPWIEAELAQMRRRGSIRNAQNLSSVCAAAAAAGLDFVRGEDDPAKIVARIVAGAEVKKGAFAGIFFGLPTLSAQEQREALAYLVTQDGSLCYQPSADRESTALNADESDF